MNEPWLTGLTVEELPEPYREIARRVDIETALILGREFGGMTWYFPKLDRALRGFRDKKIREMFNGANHRGLARKFNLTESQIRAIVDISKEKKLHVRSS